MHSDFNNLIRASREGMSTPFLALGGYIAPLDTDGMNGGEGGLKTFRFELLDNDSIPRIKTSEEWREYLDAAKREEDEPVKEEAPEELPIEALQPRSQITPLHPALQIKRINLETSGEDDRFIDLTVGYEGNDGAWVYHSAAEFMSWLV